MLKNRTQVSPPSSSNFPLDVTLALSEDTELATIDIGDSLPSFTLKNEKGEDVDVATLAAEKGVIFFLVPKADTRQSSLFRPFYALASIETLCSRVHNPGMRLPRRLPRLYRIRFRRLLSERR